MTKLVELMEELKRQFPFILSIPKGTHKAHFVDFETLDRIEVKSCFTAVELSKDVLSRGIAEKVDLFVTHHDLFSSHSNQMIHGLRRQMIRALQSHGIVVYALEDSILGAENGLSEALVSELGLAEYIIKNFNLENNPVGRIAQLPNLPTQNMVEKARKVMKTPQIRLVRGRKSTLEKTLIVAGTLEIENLKKALPERIDSVVTGDFGYEVARLAVEENVFLFGVGHICSEAPGMRNLAMDLAIKYRDVKIDFMPSPGLIGSG
ncbi:MAG: Nif3-like dinuclear metal center hexameric protein [Candidatus Heimdallarchaeota archaeon]